MVPSAGNLLTLLSIPYARYRRRFGFQRINDSTTLYILNLAFCDFLFCLVPAPIFALHLIYRDLPILGVWLQYGSCSVDTHTKVSCRYARRNRMRSVCVCHF